MAEFIGLYRGQTISDAELVALTAEPRIVRRLLKDLLGEEPEPVKGDEFTERSWWPESGYEDGN